MLYLRSDEHTFTYKDNGIFCGCPDLYDGKKTAHKLVLSVPDLPAADAVYHILCSGNFRSGKEIS